MSTALVEMPADTMTPREDGGVELPPVTQRTFNSGFLSRRDPIKAAGIEVEPFAFASTYAVPLEKQQAVVTALFTTLYKRLRGRSIPGANASVVDYKDAAMGNSESARRYLVLTSETRRSTYMGVFATFRGYGDYLYVSVDAYMLPPLDGLRLLWAVFVAFGLVLAAMLFTLGVGLLFVIPYLLWQYRDVLGSLNAGDSLSMALRRHFNAGNDFGTFNTDDVLAFFKSTASLLAEGIQEVFRTHGISVEEIVSYQKHVNMTTQVINTGGILNVMGNVVGGAGNMIKAATGR